ncbi:TIGR02206 family membrane protein [Candidatus Xianfuyuplasma coldseepsis]|uniref:TIGR02206 family membrane protein n=1 Tax=Candidatus Xianfuyuplasma coldseepsis TaxID=2782163 RepID=A0A7L7KQJ5_9MOLU|nr:TIGR02206 family membrane protein [Xianfuyuplasma coldseepsis]QMS84855.1 TIGR02206 family membrane protein [Xianfuyuplasma coldseepsis]
MPTFFTRIPLDGEKEFYLGSPPHIIALVVALILLVIVYIYLPRLQRYKHERSIRYGIVGFLLLTSIIKQSFLFFSDVPWYQHLPEATCGYAIITSSIMLLTKNRTLFVITFFWGWGAFLALFAPNLLETWNRLYFYQFYLRHMMIVIAGLYMIRVHKFSVYKRDYQTYITITLSLAIIGYIVSTLINHPNQFNMMYMVQPPVENIILYSIYDVHPLLYTSFWVSVAFLFGYLYGLPFYQTSSKHDVVA